MYTALLYNYAKNIDNNYSGLFRKKLFVTPLLRRIDENKVMFVMKLHYYGAIMMIKSSKYDLFCHLLWRHTLELL